uniref:Kinesin motor domain-containing protein n=1 Tax=Haptolina brevifila TaxID=156173 RepID=A0A7S2JPI6_9EUKA|mmetsp:Transcript_8599/g.17473  ORF Transcript_8599/g.17473 Transcript_8599/m.17473 type:complete len:410 (+) Transcript_8599:58-1287(+)
MQNLSLRGARLEYSSRFEQAINDYRAVSNLVQAATLPEASTGLMLARLPADCLRQVVRHMVGSFKQADSLLSIAEPLRPPPGSGQFEVCVRKRPIWSSELESGEYDAVTTEEANGRCAVHDGKAARDMSTYTLHREYALDRVFDADSSEGHMHSTTLDPLLAHVCNGGRATLICFGQTGTGKSYTAHRMQNYLAECLFPEASSGDDEGDGHWAFPTSQITLEVEAFELRQKKAFDLLNDRSVVRLVTDSDEQIHVLHGTKEIATTRGVLLELINRAHALRSVAATERNAQSSRSHAICRLRLPNGGCFTLVDLAGSERNSEVTKHDRTMTLESADINTSLQTLKECFRATYNMDGVQLDLDLQLHLGISRWLLPTLTWPTPTSALASLPMCGSNHRVMHPQLTWRLSWR